MLESIAPSVSNEPLHSEGSQIETGQSLARALFDSRNARRKEEMLSRANPLDRPQIRANQRALKNLVASHLIKTGFEVDKVEVICEQLRTELRLSLEEHKAKAVKNSAHVSETLRRSAHNMYQAFRQLDDNPKEILDKPILIWQTQGIDFPEVQYEPGRSLAKFVVNATRDGEEEMSFYFLWQNPSDKFVVINVDSCLVFNGLIQALVGGGFLGQGEATRLILKANLFLFEEPPFTTLSAADTQYVETVIAMIEGWLVPPGQIDSAYVHKLARLHYGPFLVAPFASMLFEVTASMSFLADDGSVLAEFARGDFQVMCPGVIITILS
jgi:hypothetical protein